jgi:metal-responsive CopG/Arc/MetJ family transcriptional regulator
MKMGRITKIIGFSAPPAMVEEFEQLAQDEGRTKSELFREMLRLYRTYRKQMEQAEAARLDEIVERVLEEAHESPMTEEEMDEAERELVRYGARKAKALGIKNEEDVDRIIYEARKRGRKA